MELVDPLATLVGRTQSEALRVLARTDAGITGRQVARMAGAAMHTGIKRALDKLERSGLVLVDRGLQHSSYRVNRDHLLWPSVELALHAPDELDRRIGALARTSDAVESVAVYGSVARGDASAESDVDLVVVFADAVDDELVARLGDLVRRWTGNTCQVFDLTRTDLERSVRDRDPIVDSWRADARTIVGTDLRALL
jgi:predicted nucleotidyltransferase